MKPGYKTTEFWLMLIAQAVAFMIASGAIVESSATGKALAAVASILGAIGYAATRTSAKNKDALASATKDLAGKKD